MAENGADGLEQANGRAVVSVSGLSKRFGSLTAVDNLSFEVYAGEIFGFLGPNGAGKSTTLSIISGLLDYDKGTVVVGGFDVRRDTRKVKAQIGMVPQSIALSGHLSARENVSFFAGLYGLKGRELAQATDEALAFVGLAGQEKKRAAKMSGGMQRRLNIACGIAHHPRIIILDEPTVGVDAQSREHIMESIRVLRGRGATVIYTSHYMAEVQEICDRIAIVDHGRLVALGTETELLSSVTDIKSILVRARFGGEAAEHELREKLLLLPGVRHFAIDEERGEARIDVELAFDDLGLLLGVLVERDICIESLVSEAPNLETTFLALTGREMRQA